MPVAQFLRQALAARTGTDLSVLEVRVLITSGWSASAWTRLSPAATSTRASPAGRRSATRSSRWRCSSRDLAVLDETDSGLDIDALRVVGRRRATRCARRRPELGVLVITHYQRMLDELEPDVVHLLVDGRIVASGGPELAARVETEGYEAWR